MPKAFIYLASHLPRDEVLEPAIDEVLQPIIQTLKNVVSMISASPSAGCFLGQDVDLSGIEAACGRTRSRVAAAGSSLCEVEPDMFPCIVVICGSAFAFLKVSTNRFCFRCRLELDVC